MNTSAELRELVETKAKGKSWDGVGLVDELFGIAAEVGEVSCTLAAGAGGLRFLLGTQPPFEVVLDRARSKLRTMCARLGVISNERGQDVSLYGGEATFDYGPAGPERTWRVCFQNTPGKHEFTISLVR